ncbi:MAG: MFS transporter [Bacteroidota bacterium]
MADPTASVPPPPPPADSAPRDWRKPWTWVPSLYFAEGVPYMVVAVLSVLLYKRLGLSNTEIALYTSWLYLPWVIKPFWAPLVEMVKTKRLWTIAMQVLIGGGLACVALTIPTSGFVQATLAFFWLLAFSSATHDVAADGFYMLALDEHEQAWWVGWRSTAYRAAIFAVQGAVPLLAGSLEASTGLEPVTIQVSAIASTAGTDLVGMEALPLGATPRTAPESAERNDLMVLVDSGAVEIPLASRATDEVDALVDSAKAMNLAAGFYELDEGREEEEPGWFSRWWSSGISGPLGRAITALFGEEEPPPAATTGNIAIVPFRLSGPPPEGEEVAVTFTHDDGDESLKLVEGERFVFTAENWDRPFAAVVQVDRNLDEPTAATFRATSGNIPLAWSITFFIVAGVFLALAVWHFFSLPRPTSDVPRTEGTGGAEGVLQYLVFLALFVVVLGVLLVPMMIAGILAPRKTGPWGRMFRAIPFSGSPLANAITTFFEKPEIGIAVAFVLLYRFAEGQVVKLVIPFLVDTSEAGGLALTTGQVGIAYGTVGVACLTVGGIIGGLLIARDGLGKWLLPMVVAINVPNVVYVILAMVRPDNFLWVNLGIALEQFGYGFGFAAFLMVLIYIARGEQKTAHYAIATGFMALGMMIPGLFSGWLEDLIGYEKFFIWVLIATIPSFLVALRMQIDPTFGKKKESDTA